MTVVVQVGEHRVHPAIAVGVNGVFVGGTVIIPVFGPNVGHAIAVGVVFENVSSAVFIRVGDAHVSAAVAVGVQIEGINVLVTIGVVLTHHRSSDRVAVHVHGVDGLCVTSRGTSGASSVVSGSAVGVAHDVVLSFSHLHGALAMLSMMECTHAEECSRSAKKFFTSALVQLFSWENSQKSPAWKNAVLLKVMVLFSQQ